MSEHRPLVLPLERSTVLIAGGTSGVGLASALQLAAAGVPRIALFARGADRGRAACQTVRQRHPATQVEFISVDATNVESVAAAVAKIEQSFGSIDALVNTMLSGYLPRLFHEIPPVEVADILLKQAAGVLNMCRAVLPGMRQRKTGSIVNIASDAAKVPTPGEAVIGAGMAAIVVFSRTLAMEAKRDGIRVNTLTPSLIANTPGYDLVHADRFSSRLFTKAAAMAHLGVAEPDDLASLVVYLLSPAAAKLTGQTISVNGGISAG